MDTSVRNPERVPAIHPRLLTVLAALTCVGAVVGIFLIEWFGMRFPSGIGPALNFDIVTHDWQGHGREQLFLYLGTLAVVALFGFIRLILMVPPGHRAQAWLLAAPASVALVWAAWHVGPWRTVLAMLLGAALLLQRARAGKGPLASFALLVLGAWVALHAALPLLRASSRSSSASTFVFQQEHYALTVLPALDIVTGTYQEVGYGHMPLVLGFIGRSVRLATGADLSIVRLVALSHVVAIAIALGTAWILGRRSAPPLVVLMVAAIPLNAFAVGYALGTPNLTGQRYLPALAVLLVLAVHAHRRWRDARLLGVAAGLALGTSTEVGMLALAAAAVYLLLQTGEGTPVQAMRILGTLVGSVLIGAILVRGVVALRSGTLAGNTSTAAAWLSGFGGGTMGLHPIAAVLVLVTLGTLIWMLALERPLAPRAALAAGILTAAALQWVVYANRTYVSNVWFGVLLLGLAAMALAGLESDESIPARERDRYRPASVILVMALSIMAVVPPLPGLPDVRILDCSREPVYGFCLEGPDGDAVHAAIDELEGFSRSDTAVLSSMPAVSRSMGFNADLVHNRGVFRTDIPTGVQLASRELEERGVRRVIVQTPDSTLGSVSPGATSAFLDIVAGVEGFRLVRESANWLVFER